MDPRDFQKLAQRLSAGSSVAEYRTAIGRAYYSAFNVAADYLRSMGFSLPRSAAAHGDLLHCLANGGAAELSEVASLLRRLHGSRNRADYRLELVDIETKTAATTALQLSESAIKTMDLVLHGPQRAQIQSAIAAWRRANGYP